MSAAIMICTNCVYDFALWNRAIFTPQTSCPDCEVCGKMRGTYWIYRMQLDSVPVERLANILSKLTADECNAH